MATWTSTLYLQTVKMRGCCTTRTVWKPVSSGPRTAEDWFSFQIRMATGKSISWTSTARTSPSGLTRNRVADDLPRWSKDGKYILFTSDNDGDFDLYTMYRDGTGQRRITSNDTDEVQFDW